MNKQLLNLIANNSRLESENTELRIQNQSFGLCLMAMVMKFGRPIEIEDADDGTKLTGDDEYVFRDFDFEHTMGARLIIESLPDIDGEPGTLVQVIRPKIKVEEKINGRQEKEAPGS